MKIIAAALASLALAAPARAIELSLEENRAERGNVGYVDMQRLFSNSPDAQRAKESFEELVRQAAERVNMRKAELIKLGQDLDAARAKREELVKSAETAPAVAAATTPAAAVNTLALPGMSPLEAAPPAASTSAAPSSTPAEPAPGPTLAQKLVELDGRILSLQNDIRGKEGELERERGDSDKGLLDIEGRKTDQVLARLYRAILAVAHQEGVSVVVDKSTILYGHPAVDLTEKVLKHLKGGQHP